jgi:hypothetical protein
MNFVGKTPSVQGFVVIFTACSAQVGSHSRSLLSAAAHGLAAWSLPEGFAVSSPVAIFFLHFRRLLRTGKSLFHWMNSQAMVMQFFFQSFWHPIRSLKNSSFSPLWALVATAVPSQIVFEGFLFEFSARLMRRGKTPLRIAFS